jgi:hypothetical protein
MASDVAKAARKNDVYELVRLAHLHEGDRHRLAELGAALSEVVGRLDPPKTKDELAHVLRCPSAVELEPAAEAATKALVGLGQSAKPALLSTGLDPHPPTRLRVAAALDLLGEKDEAARVRGHLRASAAIVSDAVTYQASELARLEFEEEKRRRASPALRVVAGVFGAIILLGGIGPAVVSTRMAGGVDRYGMLAIAVALWLLGGSMFAWGTGIGAWWRRRTR